MYSSTYAVHRFTVPLGWDTAGYVWRARFAQAFGVANLPLQAPPPGPLNPGRPGFVTIASLLSSLTRTQPLVTSAVVPAVAAAACGLAAGVVVRVMLGRATWESIATAVAVGTSSFMVHVINVEAYQDYALALTVFVAAATPTMLAIRDRRAAGPAVFLLAATGLMHWTVLEIGAIVVLITAAVYVPASLRRETPATWASVRLATIAVAGTAVAAAFILLVLSAPLPSPRLDEAQFLLKIQRDLPAYRLPFALAAAAAGALLLIRAATSDDEPGARTRSFLAFALSWCELTVVLFFGGWILGRAIPTHRALALCLAVPLLGTVAVLRTGDVVGRRFRALRAAVVVVAIAGSASLALSTWLGYRPVMSDATLAEARAAAAYLDARHVDVDHPVVFVVDAAGADAWSDVWLKAHTIRAALPPGRVEATFFAVGTPQDYLRAASRRPRRIGPVQANGAVEAVTQSYADALRPALRSDPLAFVLRSANAAYADWTAAHRADIVAPGVGVIGAPATRATVGIPGVASAAAVRLPGAVGTVGAALAALAVLGLVGGGWSSWLFRRWYGAAEVCAVSPSVGAAVLVTGGVVSSRVGLALRGWSAVAIVAGLSLGGWLVARVTAQRQGRAAPPTRSREARRSGGPGTEVRETG